MTTAIAPKGTSGVTNLPASTGSQGKISGDTMAQDGMVWGAEVAGDKQGDGTFDFDDYAQSTAVQMQGLGYTSTATAQYVNAMYAGYLAAGGDASGQATGAMGASSNAEAGIYGALATGNLSLPGHGQEPPIGGKGGMSLSPSTAATIGQNLATNAGVNYQQWRANMEGDLEDAGYNQAQVTQFMAQVDTAFYSAIPNNIVNQGIALGQNLSGFSTTTDVEQYIASNLVPSLQARGLSAKQINAYVEGVRAGAFGGPSSNAVSLGLQQGQEVASYESATSSFNFDSYSQSVATVIASPSSGLNPLQQRAYLAAMYAGYLRGGGGATTEMTTVSELSTNTAGTGPAVSSGTGPAVSSGTGSSATAAGPSPTSPPSWASQIYTGIAQAPSSAALSTDANDVQTAVAALSSAAQLAQQSPTSTHAGNLRTQWQNTRAAEAQFWSDLAFTNDPNATSAAAISQKFTSDPRFTLEGEMPASYGPGAMATAPSSALVTLLDGLAASSALGPGVSLPSNLAQFVANPTAISSMSQNDFTSMAEGLVALYQQNPGAYYGAIQSIHDPNLAGALNYAVQDMVTNGADSLVQNQASLTQENNTLAGYYQTALASPSSYAAWMPVAASVTASMSVATGLGSVPTSTNDYANITAFLTSSSFDGSSPAKFAEACAMMANLWKTNQPAYYQVLSGIPDPDLRNAINAGVQTEFTNNPQDVSNDRAAGEFASLWLQVFGKTGPGASSPTFLQSHLNVSSQTGGAS